MERNQAVSKALLEPFDQSTIKDMTSFDEMLWVSIGQSAKASHLLEIFNDEKTSLEFVIKVLVKIGFKLEDSVRLMLTMHKDGCVTLANAEEWKLLHLQEYINAQAEKHHCYILTNIRKV